ncbi:MAG: class I SAM-dependent methyltransferase [Chloroflexi bacterium]|nr:class I SAM-dependent methyltransferase [Chloroflexota bacterium]
MATRDEEGSLEVRARYNRAAYLYDLVQWPMEALFFRRWRRRLWKGVEGKRILELGVGTGANFPHYPRDRVNVAVDLSDKMLGRAQKRSRQDRLAVALAIMDVEKLAFRDDTFDTVVTSFVFCSVADPVAGLKEVARVCKPSGKIYLLEHVRSQTILGWFMDLLNPLAVRLGGENINRRTAANVNKAGLHLKEEKKLLGDVVQIIEAQVTKGQVMEASNA